MASGRPVHPLFGGGGLKNELALKAKSMNARHGGIQETAAQGGRGPSIAAPVTSRPTPPSATPAAPVARPPHPLFGGGGGLSELKSAASALNARHGGISETKPQAGRGSTPAPAPSRAAAGPPNPFGGAGGMSLQDQIKAKAAKRNARIQAGEPASISVPPPVKPSTTTPRAVAPSPVAVKKSSTPPRAAPTPPTPAVAPSLADQIAVKAAQRKERLGYDDPIAAKPQREGPRPVPAADAWMAPAEKWTSAPPVESIPPAAETPSSADGPTKIVTKTEKVTKPRTSKRIIRRKIIKKADGTQETITTIIDAATGQEINQDGTPAIKPLAESTDYETTKTVTKTSAPANDSESTKILSTETSTSTSSERPSYMPEVVTTTKQVEPSKGDEELPVSEVPSTVDESPTTEVPVEVPSRKDPGWMAPAEKWTRDAPVEPLSPIEPIVPEPTPPAPVVTRAAPAPPPSQAKSVSPSKGVNRPAKVSTNKPAEPALAPSSTPGPASTHAVKGTVITTTRTVTTTKTFIPAEKKKKVSLFSTPVMKNGTSKVVSTVTKTEAATLDEPIMPPASQTKAKAKRGWFGRKN